MKKQKKMIEDLLNKVESQRAQSERIEAEKKSAVWVDLNCFWNREFYLKIWLI